MMRVVCNLRVVVASLLLALGPWLARAADVPYVPTPWVVVDAMLKLGAVGPNDYLIDLGSGDGRIVIAAAKRLGARGFGVDLDDNLVRTARRNAESEGVKDRTEFFTRNLFDTDMSKASVITMYLFNSVNLRLRPSLANAPKIANIPIKFVTMAQPNMIASRMAMLFRLSSRSGLFIARTTH